LDPIIVGLTAFFVLFGLAMLMSATGPTAVQSSGDSLFFVKRQVLSGVIPGMIGFFFLALIDYRRWKPFAIVALGSSLVLLILVYIPNVGHSLGGSRSWVQFGKLSFQPSEFVKLSFLVYVSAWLAARRGSDAHDVQTGLMPFLGALGAVMLLLMLQPDTGSMAVIVGMSLTLYFISGAPIVWFIGLCAAGVGLLAALVKFSPYRAARFMTFLHPELDPKGIGYHINQAILAIGSGGWWGVGYGNSRQKFLYLPEVQSDSIIAVMAEEMGFLVMALYFVAFGYLVWRCFAIARATEDRFGSYLAAGIGSWLAIQFFLNAGSMCGLLPITGVTLPFISHGGSAMAVTLAAMGLVAGIPRTRGRTR
jgi:cell division protein FtsW